MDFDGRRFAAITIARRETWDEAVARTRAYLPWNYHVVGGIDAPETDRSYAGRHVLISGRDNAGWTLDGYVLPRLMSGMIAGHEVTL